MALIDRRGVLHGSVSNMVYRSYRGQQIAQLKPAKVKQTVTSKEAGLEFGRPAVRPARYGKLLLTYFPATMAR